MSKRAEEAALKAYPPLSVASVCLDGTVPVDLNTGARKRFVEGYEQAEKDLELTIQDLELLHTFLYAVKNNKHGAFTFTRLSDEQYKGILTRFKQIKEAKKNTKTK